MFNNQNQSGIILMLIIAAILSALSANTKASQSYKPVKTHIHSLQADQANGAFVLENVDGAAACRDATPEESQALTNPDDLVGLHIISPAPDSSINAADTGLKIILRATQQLEDFPQAKNSFLRAAATWEKVIQSPITVIIDVDYGPLRFGQPYPDANILGSTTAQKIGGASIYPQVRGKLISQATSQRESQIDNALPPDAIQTDIGTTAGVFAPSAIFRALGMISPVADPASEGSFGRLPAIGFNSNFGFDFDPDNGIDAGKTDFDAVAVHELGHALGFFSNVGSLESSPGSAISLSLLDLFRLRPGVGLAGFPTAPRIQSSGGTQVFFFGPSELALSTGRPDGSGGDGRQSSHWKDDDLIGEHLGIMDPTIPPGRRFTITPNDLLAFDSFGYQVRSDDGDTVPLVSGVSRQGSISAPGAGQAVVGSTQYSVIVPNGTTELKLELSGNQDVDLYVRFNQRIAPGASGRPLADFVSESPTGVESMVVSRSSSPALIAGTYYIAVVNFGPGNASFEVRATTTGGGNSNSAPRIVSLKADLTGDQLTLTGTVVDPDGDIIQAQSTLFNRGGAKVGETDPFPVSFGNQPTIDFSLEIDNLNAIPAAELTSLSFIDRRGNRSAPVTADFGEADNGGPSLKVVSYSGSKLTIKGADLAGDLQIEINGRVVVEGFNGAVKKIKVKGSPNTLNLRSGSNRVRVSNGNSRSNLLVFDF